MHYCVWCMCAHDNGCIGFLWISARSLKWHRCFPGTNVIDPDLVDAAESLRTCLEEFVSN